jgi:plasmid stabilization system protein ParE
MTVRVRRAPRADLEIDEIVEYLSQHSPAAAERFVEALERAHRRLSMFPDSGRPGLAPGTRRLVVGDYIVSYRRRGEDVEIFAVRHARRRDARF